ncbi:MAG TPA: hypothetical protein VKZ79_11995 [Alphaproteobacteria bacterium]|nr:hypothetical protein [Alphaproteobacteria bacterium]
MAERLIKASAVALIGAIAMFPAAANAACVPTADQKSVGMRALQTELMVAGLKCGAERWNSFAKQFKTTLKSDADRLQSLFRKTYGRGGAERMNAFVTQLANDASQRSNGTAEADYCRQENQLFEQVLALTGTELERFSASRALAVPAPVALCQPEDGLSATTVAAARPGPAVGPRH